MKINVNDIRTNMVLEYEGKLWRVSKTMHTQPGKGGAFMQVEMKDIVNGTKTNVRFRSAETVERAEMEQRRMLFLYAEDGMLNLMDNSTYEQITVPSDIAGEPGKWLEENMEVEVETHSGKPIGLRLPDHIEVEIVEADASIKGQTANNSFKNAKSANGINLLVPPFIQVGDKVRVSTNDDSYVERV